MYRGIDIGVFIGILIVVVVFGIVIYVDWDGSGYGYLVEIKYFNGSFIFYVYNSEILVREG